MATEVGQLSIALTLDNKALNSSIKETESTVTSGFTVIKGAMAGLVAQGVSAATNAVKSFASSIVTTGMQFDTAMSQVAATMGTTVDQIQDLSTVAQQMGATTKFTAIEAAEGLNILAMAGLSAQEQIAGIPVVLDLASAGAMSLESAASYVVGAVNGFSDSMNNAQYYADLMAKGATLANTSVAGLGEAFSRSAATASSYGQSADSVTLSLLRLATQNVTGEAAATALNRAMADLYTPTKNAASALDALGISVYDSSGAAKDFNVVTDELVAALADMSDEEANAYKATIFTTQGLNAFNKMTAISSETVAGFADGIANAFGSASRQARVQIDNLEGSMTILNSSFDGVKLSIYNSLRPALLDGANGLLDFAGALSAVVNGTDPAEFINGFIENMSTALTSGLGMLGEIISKAAPVLIEAFVGIVPNLIQGLLNAMTTIMTSVAAKLPEIMESIVDAIMQIATMLTRPQNLQMILNAFLQMMLAMVKAIPKIIVAIVKALPDLIMGIIDFLTDPATIMMLLQAAVELFMALVEAIPEITFALLEALGNLVGMIFERIGESFNWLGEHFSELPSMIWQYLSEAFGKFGEWIGQMVGRAGEFGGQFLAKIGEFFSQLPGNIWNFLTQAIGKIAEFIGSVIPMIIEFGAQFLGNIVNFFSQIPGNVAAFLGEVISNVASWVGEMIGKAVEAGSQFLQNIVNFITQLPGKIWQFLTETISKVVSFVGDFAAKALQAGKEFFENIVNKVKEIPGEMLQIGKNIVEGIWNGISGAAGWLGNKVKEFCSGVVDKIKSFFHIGSPSKLMADEIGVFLAQGMEMGFGDEMPEVNAKMTHDIETGLDLPEMAGAGLDGWLSPILSNMSDDESADAPTEGVTVIQNNTINDQLDIQQVSNALLEEIRSI